MSERIAVESIKLDSNLQPRNELNGVAILQYAEDMRNGAEFPPVEIKKVGGLYYLTSGWHRVLAAKKAGISTIAAIVTEGTLTDATWEACGANIEHDRVGLRRTNADKQKAVKMALRAKAARNGRLIHGEYTEIANHCGVSLEMVRKYAINLGVDTEISQPHENSQSLRLSDPTPQPQEDRASTWDRFAERAKQYAEEERAKQDELAAIQAEIKTEDIAKLNKTNDNIEWAAWSWNPVTGCLHDCPYCYARDIANRFYPEKFQPSFHPGRLDAPDNTNVPVGPRFAGDIGYKNIFTCSMADLFGKWVPVEWIEAVLTSVKRNPQWTFLFLTKFPIRMAEFDYPSNVWLGTTVDRQHAVQRAESAFRKIKDGGFTGVCWLSCEPMLERLTFSSLNMFDWVVMGGSSESTQTPAYFPPRADVNHLQNQARQAGCKIYEKTNLLSRIREYPDTIGG